MFADAEEAGAVALTPTDPAFAKWSARQAIQFVIGGFCELGRRRQSLQQAVMVDATEMLACYRKTHLWTREVDIHPGDALPPVVKTKHGDIAVMVCYDIEFAELTRPVAVDGAH